MDSQAASLRRRPEAANGVRRRLWWLLPLTVHGALLWLYYQPQARPGFGDEAMYLRAARGVAELGNSGLDSFWPPAYAWFLAPWVAAAGGEVWIVQFVQTALLVVAAWLLSRLVGSVLEDRWAAESAMILTLSFPPLAAFAHYLWPEVLHLALMLGAVTLLLERGPKLWMVALAGLVLALCLQTKVLLLPFVPLLAVGLWLRWPPSRRTVATGVLLAAIGVGVLPTVVAQNRDFGRPMIADSGWFNLWVGLNEVSRREFVDSVVIEEYPRYRAGARSAAARSKIARDKIGALVEERGWWPVLWRQLGRQYHRLFARDSFLTHQLVGGTLWRQGRGYSAGDSAAGHVLRWWSYVSWAAVLAAAAWGVVVFPYRRRPLGMWILGFLLLQCAIFLVLHVKSRYRVQMLPSLFFFAVYAAAWWRSRGLSGALAFTPRARLVAAALAAGALVWVANDA